VVDRLRLATHIASIRDAVARIREVLPADPAAFAADRTAREVVALNLFVAIQDAIDLAVHWLADEGSAVPESYRAAFLALAEQGVVDVALAENLAAASGLRNLLAHRYGALDWARIHGFAATRLGDLEAFCTAMARRAGS
jgi:uncharacterized protein YutE (UPF0331/DUF86 family)